jgi:hypothetical protein
VAAFIERPAQTAAYKDILFDVYYFCSSAFRLPELKPNSDY